MKRHLNDLTISKLPFGATYIVWDAALPTFGVRVGRQAKSFIIKQANRYHVLGRYPACSLKQCRDEAKRRIALKYFPRQTLSTQDAVRLYLDAKKHEHREATSRLFTTYLQRLPDRPLHELTPQYVYSILPEKRGAANASFTVIKAFLSWCVERGYLDQNLLLKRKHPYKSKSRERLFSDDEIASIWKASFAHTQADFGILCRALILSGQRVTQFAQFDHLWIAGETIAFPDRIMKSGVAHTIPLTPLLKDNLPRTTLRWPHNFMAELRNQVQLPPFTLHDFRRYVASTMSRLGIAIDISEAVLAHKAGSRSQVQRIYDRYNRLEPMRAALAHYHEHLLVIGCRPP